MPMQERRPHAQSERGTEGEAGERGKLNTKLEPSEPRGWLIASIQRRPPAANQRRRIRSRVAKAQHN